MRFKLGDTVRVINSYSGYFDQVGRITEIEKTGLHPRPFGVSGLSAGGTVCYAPEELILAEKDQP
ncbi:hypothetical protein AB0O52_17535 [Arthrobacter sp. NPDC080073]|uniref:hypothetical protein n=1 Tax=Arthrobacter sp. NPDC080073 TaxID=3155919 RepID=UPI0034488490